MNLALRFRRSIAYLDPRRSLNTRLGLAITAIALILALSASLMAGRAVSRQVKTDVGQQLANLAYQMTDKLDRGMFERYRDIQIIASLNELRDPQASQATQRSLLETLQVTYPDYSWIGFADSQGIVQVSTKGLLEGVDVSERPWFMGGLESAYVGDVHEALLLAKLLPNPTNGALYFVDVATPVFDLDGNLLGVLGAHLSWSWAQEVKASILNSLENPQEEMLVLSKDGTVLLGPESLQLEQRSDLTSFQQALLGHKGYTTEAWPNGETYLTGFVQSQGYRNYPGLGWIVLVRQPTHAAFLPAQRLQRQILLGTLGLGLLFAVLGWLAADRITTPMLAIARAADRIRYGDTNIQIPVKRGHDEIAGLSRSLSQLVSTLIRQEADLKGSNRQLLIELAERQRIEVVLRESDEKFRQIAENISDVFWMQTPQRDRLLYVSPAYEAIWGETCESLYHKPTAWLDAVHPEDRQRVIDIFVKNVDAAHDEEYRIVRSDGSICWLRDRAFPVRNGQGEIYRIVGLTQDITARKQIKETEQQLIRERELSEMKSRFIAIASHEFRTPLTVISMAAEMLEKFVAQSTAAQREKYFIQIRSSVKRLIHLLDEVLIVGRAEAGKLDYNPSWTDFQAFCCQLVEDFQLSAQPRHTLVFNSQGNCQQAYFDEELMRHMLTNLLSNAIKYSPDGGKVWLDVACHEQGLTLRIQDQGIGIPERDRAKLFTSFHRCSNTGKLPGTGLGLSIVKEVVELHGGEITVESKEGKGTTFVISLPQMTACDPLNPSNSPSKTPTEGKIHPDFYN